MLTTDQARAFYNRLGAGQDAQGFYEDAATADLTAHADFSAARAVVEFGCGTGRFAAGLLASHLAPACTYVGVDLSPAMVSLARAKLDRYGARAAVRLVDGSPRLDAPDGAYDRFVSNYVLDLLPEEAIRAVVAEARRVLSPGGLACLVSLTRGEGRVGRAVTWSWERLHALRPVLVGGCRPIRVVDHLPADAWRVEHRAVVSRFGLSSEVVVASRRA